MYFPGEDQLGRSDHHKDFIAIKKNDLQGNCA